VPGIIIGKNDRSAWSMTAPKNDNSDLYKEKLSRDGKTYIVDGQ
jgi:acyl-homoserine lactone acylase PvdQ